MKPECLQVGREKTSAREDRTIAKIVKAERFETAAAVSREFNTIMKKNLSQQTVSRRLAEHDLHARTPAVKPWKNTCCFCKYRVTWSEQK